MIENKYEERQVTQRVLTGRTYVCDVCGRCSKECVNEIYDEFFRNCQNELDKNDFIEVTHQCTHSVEEISRKSDKEN